MGVWGGRGIQKDNTEEETDPVGIDIKNGFAIYEFPNGDKYEGNWKNNLMHGKGTYLKPDGFKYEGEFKNGIRTGFGKTFWHNGFFIGEWNNGIYNGKGVFIW